MSSNYLKISLRNIVRHKTFSLINILGLSTGISCTILIILWTRSELNYDRFHRNFNEIHRVVTDYYPWVQLNPNSNHFGKFTSGQILTAGIVHTAISAMS